MNAHGDIIKNAQQGKLEFDGELPRLLVSAGVNSLDDGETGRV
jgi:hypothetical protein